MAVSGMLYLGVVACSQIISAQEECFIEEDAKFYELIAGNTGIGSPPSLVFPAEIVNYTRLEFLLQVNLIVGNV
jgi:hypothetical protein